MKKRISGWLCLLFLTTFCLAAKAEEEKELSLGEKLQQAKEEYQEMLQDVFSIYNQWCQANFEPKSPIPDLTYRRVYTGPTTDPTEKSWGTDIHGEGDINLDGQTDQAFLRFYFAKPSWGKETPIMAGRILLFNAEQGILMEELLAFPEGFCWVDIDDKYPGPEMILWRAGETFASFVSPTSPRPYTFNIVVWTGQEYEYIRRYTTKERYQAYQAQNALVGEFQEFWQEFLDLRAKDKEATFNTPKEAIRHYYLLERSRIGIEFNVNPWDDESGFYEIYQKEDLCLVKVAKNKDSAGDGYLGKRKDSLGWRVEDLIQKVIFPEKAVELGLPSSRDKLSQINRGLQYY